MHTSIAFLSHVNQVTDRISNIIRTLTEITVSNLHENFLIYYPLQDKLGPLSSKGINNIPCSYGVAFIGETG